MILLRSYRSTITPANNPNTRPGAAVAISIKPTLAADPVSLNIKMEADRDVRELPMVSTNWPSHIKAKSRRRNTAKGDGGGETIDDPAAVTLDPLFDYKRH